MLHMYNAYAIDCHHLCAYKPSGLGTLTHTTNTPRCDGHMHTQSFYIPLPGGYAHGRGIIYYCM